MKASLLIASALMTEGRRMSSLLATIATTSLWSTETIGPSEKSSSKRWRNGADGEAVDRKRIRHTRNTVLIELVCCVQSIRFKYGCCCAPRTSNNSTQYMPPTSAHVFRAVSTSKRALAIQRKASSAASGSDDRRVVSAASKILKFY